MLRYAIAFATEDTEGMKRAASAAAGKPWAEDWMTQTEALAAAELGGRSAWPANFRAKPWSRRSVWDSRSALRGTSRRSPWMKLSLDFQGKPFEPRLKLCKCRTAAMLSTLPRLPSAWREDVQQADVLRKDLHDRFPEDTAVNRIYLPVIKRRSGNGQKGMLAEAVESFARSRELPAKCPHAGETGSA